jgi:LPXTG-motif cell wall-anchored protein
MRSILAALLAAGAVSFAGAGVANATTTTPVPASPVVTSTTLAADEVNDDGDNTGLWGLAGLLGLLGLLGLKRRNDVDRRLGTAPAAGRGTDPRV